MAANYLQLMVGVHVAATSHIILSLLLALKVAVMSSHQPSPHERTKSRSLSHCRLY